MIRIVLKLITKMMRITRVRMLIRTIRMFKTPRIRRIIRKIREMA